MAILLSVFIIGLFIGSFLNVLADRLNRNEGFVTGRSHCESCRHTLSFWDLIPLLSFLYIKGKCRYCFVNLSWYYPISEVLTGLLFMIAYQVFGDANLLQLCFSFVVVGFLIVIFLSDSKYGIIPDSIVISLVFLSLLFGFFSLNILYVWYVVSAIGSGLFFLFLFLITKGKGMGFGDVKLSFFIGLLLGFPNTIYALYLAFLTGGIVSLILILWRKKTIKSTIPFGPFLVFGTLFVYLFPGIIENLVQMVLR